MPKFRFEYEEISTGFIDIEADSEADAISLLENGEVGDTFINNSTNEIGDLIEVID
jgi:hypothetical protein